jgi:hypothetical protein
MAKSSTRRVTIYINDKEVEASVKQIRAEMNKLVNEQNRIGHRWCFRCSETALARGRFRSLTAFACGMVCATE